MRCTARTTGTLDRPRASAPGGDATIDGENGPRDPGCLLRGEEGDGADDITRGTDPAEGVAVLARPDFDPADCDVAFRIGLNDVSEMMLLPRVLARLGELAPRASLQVVSGGYFRIPDALATGELDAVAGYYDSSKLSPHHHEADLFRIQLTCLARRAHPLVKKGRITKKRYLEASHVVVTETWGARGIVDEVMPTEPNDPVRHIGARVPRLSLVPALVAQTDLLCAIEGLVADAFLPSLPLQRVTVPFRLPGGTVGMVWHERTHHDPARAFLRRLIREAAGQK